MSHSAYAETLGYQAVCPDCGVLPGDPSTLERAWEIAEAHALEHAAVPPPRRCALGHDTPSPDCGFCTRNHRTV